MKDVHNKAAPLRRTSTSGLNGHYMIGTSDTRTTTATDIGANNTIA